LVDRNPPVNSPACTSLVTHQVKETGSPIGSISKSIQYPPCHCHTSRKWHALSIALERGNPCLFPT
jgi:hypothetical protein